MYVQYPPAGDTGACNGGHTAGARGWRGRAALTA
eukprot:CAMPEP_0182546262 /NCGR_PEP_ID=MMETSP1323-20130603/35766_1 /TAXON_ID=236787 /ORGANISM="Florenciella parvula, Strain RCC1693" /LENGTH=33 /DNA_ID= /DNA_START= /DNA_END= /DNA_ORIENTATION=